jgi:hypothetical protein
MHYFAFVPRDENKTVGPSGPSLEKFIEIACK